MSARVDRRDDPAEPLALLERWLAEAAEADVPRGSIGRLRDRRRWRASDRAHGLAEAPARIDALVFTSALWTRKARELAQNPHVALLFHWPSLGRQVHVAGEAVLAERALAQELFAEREPSHQLQTIVSRQGEPIDDLAPLRARHAHLLEAMEAPPACPPDWGAIRVSPRAVEFWSEATIACTIGCSTSASGDGWSLTRLSP